MAEHLSAVPGLPTGERLAVAEASVRSAHHRLDGYNGQITELRQEVTKLRVEMAAEVAAMRVRVGVVAAVGAAGGSILVGVVVAVVVGLLER